MTPVYLFEARSIQSYISETGKLKDLAGASQLVDALAAAPDAPGTSSVDLVGAVAGALGLQGLSFSRRAGGAFIVSAAGGLADLKRLRTAFTLAVQGFAPDLKFTDAIGQGDTLSQAIENAAELARAGRAFNTPCLPDISPFTDIAPRTGRAAAMRATDGLIDAATVARRSPVEHARFFSGRGDKLEGLERRMLPPARREDFAWPVEFSDDGARSSNFLFPGLDENATLGVIHADGNGMGQTVINVGAALRDCRDAAAAGHFLLLFSMKIAEATDRAVQHAVEAVLIGKRPPRRVLAARPIVLGGDDLTIMVRGDLALPFCVAFQTAFALETAVAFADIRAAVQSNTGLGDARRPLLSHLPTHFSAGAGIVFLNASMPFNRSCALAEAIAKEAKTAAKKGAAPGSVVAPATVQIHRITSSMYDDFKNILSNDLAFTLDGKTMRLTMGAYGVADDTHGFPPVSALLELVQLFQAPRFPAGPLRAYIGNLRTAPYEARTSYQRWRTIMERRARKELERFDALLSRLGVKDPVSSPFTDDAEPATPLLDALAIQASSRRPSLSEAA
jgi:hypothetical protein